MADNKYYATGRRKTSVARVFLLPKGSGKITVNHKDLEAYFPEIYWDVVRMPLKVTELLGKFNVYATVKGGGLTGQAEALRHGVARAIDMYDKENHHKMLKEHKFLTRDPRMVQRKKFGLKKARKASQYSKR